MSNQEKTKAEYYVCKNCGAKFPTDQPHAGCSPICPVCNAWIEDRE